MVPEPRRWIHDPQDIELKMPKSQPLVYAQIPFFLNKMGTTEEITETIRDIRTLCEKFEEKGLPNFPTGLPFIYWEQYLGLRSYLWFALACIFIAIFLVISILLVNCWAAFVVVSIFVYLFKCIFKTKYLNVKTLNHDFLQECMLKNFSCSFLLI